MLPKPYYSTNLGVLYNADCLEIMPKLPLIDMVVTSPPYDELRQYGGYEFDYKKTAFNLFGLIRVGGVVVWVVGDQVENGSETGTSFRQALYFKDVAGFKLHDTMIYLKTGFNNPSSNRYHQVFEYMFVFSKEVPKTFNPIKDRINHYNKRGGRSIRQKNGTTKKGDGGQSLKPRGMRFNVWEISCPGISGTIHPATFNVQIPQDHITSWSNSGDLVLDPFIGSGTTAIACERLNRRWIGIEIEEKYCEIAVKRIKKERSQLKLF